MGAHVTLMEADFDHVLPFSDGRFSAAVSRLALMTASDPVVTLRELRRVTAAGGRIVTACRVPHAMRKVGRDPQRLNTAPEAARAGRGNIQIV